MEIPFDFALPIDVGARSSPLSRAQVAEVEKELRTYYPYITFRYFFIKTQGDLDQKTSLRTLNKTDFFTKEIDKLQLQGKIRIAIHSAKDLPDPLSEGLTIVALTRGIDPSDALVLRGGEKWEKLQSGALIATSSERREEAVKHLRKDLQFVDIRGTIDARLSKLFSGEVDGVVIAEAALIRLGLTHLNRTFLASETVAGQGQLAILARQDDFQMQSLFRIMDSRQQPRKRHILHLGLNPPPEDPKVRITHYPIIKTVRLDVSQNYKEAFCNYVQEVTDLIFTSQQGVAFFWQFLLKEYPVPHKFVNKRCFSVGEKTTACLRSYGFRHIITSREETSEGLLATILKYSLNDLFFLWPHSARSRPILFEGLKSHSCRLFSLILYDVLPSSDCKLPNLQPFDEIRFTSPSTIDAFCRQYHHLPKNKTLSAIGPITQKALDKQLEREAKNPYD